MMATLNRSRAAYIGLLAILPQTTSAASLEDKLAACQLAPMKIELEFDGAKVPVELPTIGTVVVEGHYVTASDQMPGDQTYPKAMQVQPRDRRGIQCDQEIDAHLKRSLGLYRLFSPEAELASLYPEDFHRVWSPEESGGMCGQGSVGDLQLELLTPDDELWLFTMNWASGVKPEPGTRFLLSHNGRHVVTIAGYETGPDVRTYIGGATAEVHAWLGTNNDTPDISVGYLVNQSLPAGPIDCGDTDVVKLTQQ